METVCWCRVGFFCLFFTVVRSPAAAEERPPADPMQLIEQQNCTDSRAKICAELKENVKQIWSRLAKVRSRQERAFLRLQLNHSLEKFQIMAEADEPERPLAELERKYKALEHVLQSTQRLSFAEAPNIAYHHLEMKAVQDVMKRFGKLELDPDIVGTKETPIWQLREVAPPWASYWYPRYDPVLYAGDASVFAKVDRMMARIGRESKAQSWEAEVNAGHPESWEGLCNAWSNASIMEAEPQFPLDVLGEHLTISDQKALLTKIYEAFPVVIHGVRYDGDYLTDGTYQDIRPEALHRVAISLLGSMKQPFIIDDTAGTEVWQQPVFKMEWSVQQDPAFENAYQISMRLWKIRMRTKISEDLTNRNDHAYDQHQYRLFVDPQIKAQEGRLVVIAGEWLGNSLKNHPDYVVLPQDNGWPATYNTWLQKNLDPILALLRHPASFLYQDH